MQYWTPPRTWLAQDKVTGPRMNYHVKNNTEVLKSSAWQKIDDQVLGSTTVGVTFGSIPQTFRHLLIEIYARGSRSDQQARMLLQCNGDTNTNYDWIDLSTSGGTVYGRSQFGQNHMRLALIPAGLAVTNVFSNVEIWIAHYSIYGRNKTADAMTSHKETTASGGIEIPQFAGHWRNNDAINKLDFTCHDGSFVAGSVFTLYAAGGVT